MKFASLLLNRAVTSVSRKGTIACPAATSKSFLKAATTVSRTFAKTPHSAREIEEELEADHSRAAHAVLDKSQGDYDEPKTKEEMAELNALYHRIDALESELEQIKAAVKDARRIFAVDGPDGEPDDLLGEEMEQVRHIVEEAAKVEDAEQIRKKHEMEREVKKARARDPEHDW
jgi:hypothetical protein